MLIKLVFKGHLSWKHTIKLPKRQKVDDMQINAEVENQITDVPNDTDSVHDLSNNELKSLLAEMDDIDLFEQLGQSNHIMNV